MPVQNGAVMPSSASNISYVPITHAKQLTSPDAMKKSLLLSLNIEVNIFYFWLTVPANWITSSCTY